MTAPSSTPRIAAVVLAAGGSSRLGRAKQLVEHDGAPLVVRAARAASGSGAAPVVVVVGAESARVREALRGEPVTLVANDRWADGLATSLAAGVRAALSAPGSRPDGVLVTLADQPLVDAAALRRLIDAFSDERRVVASTYGDALGVPALFGAEHADALLVLTGDTGAGRWLRARDATVGDVARVPMPEAALDVDTPTDLARLGAR